MGGNVGVENVRRATAQNEGKRKHKLKMILENKQNINDMRPASDITCFEQ